MSELLSRRSLLTAGGAAAALMSLSGCGAVQALRPAAGGKNTLVVHSQFNGAVAGADVFRAVVEQYRTSTGRQVATLSNGSDLPIVFETSVLAGKEADITIVNMVGKTLAWTAEDATIPVENLLAEWGLADRIEPGAIQEWTTGDGHLRAFPYTRTNWPVAFNTRLLEQAGVEVPLTSQDLIEAADALRGKGIGPVTIGGGDWSGQKLFIQIIQSFLTADEAERVFATGVFSESPGALAGIQHFADLRDAGVFVDSAQGFTSDSMLTQYNTGQAAIMSSMSSALAKVPAERAAETTIGGWPVPPGAVSTKPTVIQSFNGMGVWISENGAGKLDLVEPFVRWLFSDEVVSQFITRSGRDMSAVTDVTSTDFPLVAQAQALAAGDTVDPVILPDLLIPEAVFEPLTQATAQAFGPGTGPDQIVDVLEASYKNA
ncbi:carbohydrate ABC transporter substrate-binding protein [Kineosporia sp. J2-2]|uniref:Carbohydrate ABC transporter substrate-binding protein n=1 Tax=Kineosporia corallincola TaxID=2835133 RepID=A0ABS5TBY0_9ACTN|nr:ABC transporter substrate-binding protein [Kineosporia corallincola]MBT0768588.1 carbohydrate ABC transporter substrate-binding protein [Kineosporia corallincola]